MTFAALSAYSEEFLALRRSVARSRPHQNDQDRRSLRHREKLLPEFHCFLARSWVPMADPCHFALGLDCSRRGLPASVSGPRAFLHSARFPATGARLRAQHGDTRSTLRPLRRRRAPHLNSDRDIARLMDAAWQLRLFESFRPLTIHTLIGLLASTGLRIGEALALKVEDVKLNTSPPHLLIHESKFGKRVMWFFILQRQSNCASTSPQGRRHCTAIRRRRSSLTYTGKYLRYHSQRMMFLRLLKRAGTAVHRVSGDRHYTLSDTRSQ